MAYCTLVKAILILEGVLETAPHVVMHFEIENM